MNVLKPSKDSDSALAGETACPSCGSARVVWIGALPDRRQFAGEPLPVPAWGGSLYKCRGCLLKFRAPLYPWATYERWYQDGSTSAWSSSHQRVDHALVASYINATLPEGKSVLDFGCSTGGLIKILKPSLRKHGIEIGSGAAAIAASTTGAAIFTSLSQLPTGQCFDAILLTDVIEHVPNPRELLLELASYLRENGLLVLTTGDAENPHWERAGANWWYCSFAEHLSFVSESWLRGLPQSDGLHVIDCRRFRYLELSRWRRYFDSLMMQAYGIAPRAYAAAFRTIKRRLGRAGDISIAGAGVYEDHILAVLQKKESCNE